MNSIQPYIDLGMHTVPLRGSLMRTDDGKKTIPEFEKNWREKYQEHTNTTATSLGGVITGECSGIVAIDCYNEATWDLFRRLDPEYDFVLISKGKGYPAGTLVYSYDDELDSNFSINDDKMALDFYSNQGFIYLATPANKTKVAMPSPLPDIRPMPYTVKLLLTQLAKKKPEVVTKVESTYRSHLSPMVAQFLGQKKFHKSLFRIITPTDFRDEEQYKRESTLEPKNIPEGRGSEYLSKVSAILGADESISEEQYTDAMIAINAMFTAPMQPGRLQSTVMDPMLTGASINGVRIWAYDKEWEENKLIISCKRGIVIEAIFDPIRNIYYTINEEKEMVRSFHRDSDMFSYVETMAVSPPKKPELKRNLPLVEVNSYPHLPFGFNVDKDNNRVLNSFRQTPELLVISDPEGYKPHYNKPRTILQYLESLVPDDAMRSYLLSFVRTKLTTFRYSPVILYFMGVQGSGKDLFVGILEKIMGKIARPSTGEFLDKFNHWLVDTYFAQLDEYGNQLLTKKDKEEALGKIKSYTGKPSVQIRQMRTDGFQYDHSVTFIMTANKNPFMLEDGDRRICLLNTPNVLAEQSWVMKAGGVADVFSKIQDEVLDFCYYLATEVEPLTASAYVKPPESEAKHALIFNSMGLVNKLAFAIKSNMRDELADLAYSVGNRDLAEELEAFGNCRFRLSQFKELYEDLADYEVDSKALRRELLTRGVQLKRTSTDGKHDEWIMIEGERGEL